MKINTKIRKLKNIVFIGIIISMVVSIPVFAQSSAVINNSSEPLVSPTASMSPEAVVDPNWGNGGSEGGTHKVMGGQAYYILGNDKGTAIRNNFDEYVTNPENEWSETAINTIENYCVTTDQIENDFGFALWLGHFYGLGGTNYWGGTDPTAYTRWNNHYWEAVNWYNIDRYYSYKQLGMAMHYLCDLNAPHHAAKYLEPQIILDMSHG